MKKQLFPVLLIIGLLMAANMALSQGSGKTPDSLSQDEELIYHYQGATEFGGLPLEQAMGGLASTAAGVGGGSFSETAEDVSTFDYIMSGTYGVSAGVNFGQAMRAGSAAKDNTRAAELNTNVAGGYNLAHKGQMLKIEQLRSQATPQNAATIQMQIDQAREQAQMLKENKIAAQAEAAKQAQTAANLKQQKTALNVQALKDGMTAAQWALAAMQNRKAAKDADDDGENLPDDDMPVIPDGPGSPGFDPNSPNPGNNPRDPRANNDPSRFLDMVPKITGGPDNGSGGGGSGGSLGGGGGTSPFDTDGAADDGSGRGLASDDSSGYDSGPEESVVGEYGDGGGSGDMAGLGGLGDFGFPGLAMPDGALGSDAIDNMLAGWSPNSDGTSGLFGPGLDPNQMIEEEGMSIWAQIKQTHILVKKELDIFSKEKKKKADAKKVALSK